MLLIITSIDDVLFSGTASITLNPQIRVFSDFFCDFRLKKSELTLGDGCTWSKTTCEQKLL